MSPKIKPSEAVSHLTLDGHQHGPLATPLQDTPQFAILLGHQTPMVASRLIPLPLLTTVLLPTAHHLQTNMAIRLPDIPQLEHPPIPAHSLSRLV